MSNPLWDILAGLLQTGSSTATEQEHTPAGFPALGMYLPLLQGLFKQPSSDEAAFNAMVTDPTTRSIITKSAEQAGIPRMWLAAHGKQESGFNPKAYNESSGASGPMQFMPSTWPEYGVKDPFNPEEAYPAAATFLAKNLAKAGGDYKKAAAGYFGGPGVIDQNPEKWGPKTKAYADAIESMAGPYWSKQREQTDILTPLLAMLTLRR